MHKKNLIIWLITVVLAVFLDQISKTWASHNLNFAETMQIIPNILNFKLLYNTGAAFSSFNNQTVVLTIISFLFSVFIIKYTLQKLNTSNYTQIFCFSFLLAGALGNLIDRILFSKVIDFIDLLILPGNFPIFNMADVWINLAVFLFVLDWLRFKRFGQSQS